MQIHLNQSRVFQCIKKCQAAPELRITGNGTGSITTCLQREFAKPAEENGSFTQLLDELWNSLLWGAIDV